MTNKTISFFISSQRADAAREKNRRAASVFRPICMPPKRAPSDGARGSALKRSKSAMTTEEAAREYLEKMPAGAERPAEAEARPRDYCAGAIKRLWFAEKNGLRGMIEEAIGSEPSSVLTDDDAEKCMRLLDDAVRFIGPCYERPRSLDYTP